MAPPSKTHRFPERNTAGHVTACVASRAKLPRAGAPPSSPIFVYPKHADATPSAQGRVALQSLCLPFTTCADVASRGVRAKNALCIATLVCPPRPRLPSGEPDPQLPRAINALVEPLFLSSDSSHPATRPPPPARLCRCIAMPPLLVLSSVQNLKHREIRAAEGKRPSRRCPAFLIGSMWCACVGSRETVCAIPALRRFEGFLWQKPAPQKGAALT